MITLEEELLEGVEILNTCSEPPPPFRQTPDFDPDDGGFRGDRRPGERRISNARLGLLIFLGVDAMFFIGLITALLALRGGRAEWPAAVATPLSWSLPLSWSMMVLSTPILLLSAALMVSTLKALRQKDRRAFLHRGVLAAGSAGVVLGLQAMELRRLLTPTYGGPLGTYDSAICVLFGAHCIHLLSAVGWLLVVLWSLRGKRFSGPPSPGAELCCWYWSFVVLLWPLLATVVAVI